MTKAKPPQVVIQTRQEPDGQRWTTIGRTAGTRDYTVVRDNVIRILTEHQQAGLDPPTLAELSQKMIETDAARGWILTPSQIQRAYTDAPSKLKRHGRPTRQK
jgi:hypothetical protein